MPRYVALLVVVVALCSVGEAVAAEAEGAEGAGQNSLPGEHLAAACSLSEVVAEPAVGTAPQGLSADEIEALEGLSAENPKLADQSGGYISNDELITILLVVLIVVIIF
jgi:hypothetical protein